MFGRWEETRDPRRDLWGEHAEIRSQKLELRIELLFHHVIPYSCALRFVLNVHITTRQVRKLKD